MFPRNFRQVKNDAQNPIQSQLTMTVNPATGQPLDVHGGPLFANRGGPEAPFKGDWNNFQPRASFSYRVNDWLVARTNYGRSFLGLSSGGQAGVYNTDFQRTTPFVAFAPNNVDPGQPWANPFPAGFLEPLAGELGLLTGIGTGFTIPNPDYEIPYTDTWMAGVDVELPYNVGLDIAYVGDTNGFLGHLMSGWQFNAIGEIRSGRSLGYNGSALLVDPDGSAALDSSEQTFERWFDNSTPQNPRADGTYAWDRIGANDYRQIRFRFPDVNEPSEPQWSVSFFKNTRLGDRLNMQVRVETFNVFITRIYGGPNTDPSNATFGVVNTTSQINFARTTQLGVRFQF